MKNKEPKYTRERIIQNYFFRQAENVDKHATIEFIKTFGDSTNGLWNQIESFNSNLIDLFGIAVNANDFEYTNFIISNIEAFLEKDYAYRYDNAKVFIPSFDMKELNAESFDFNFYSSNTENIDLSEELSKIKNNYFFSEIENNSPFISKEHPSTYYDLTGDLFSNLENFQNKLLEIFEDAIRVKDDNSYVKHVSTSIDEFLISNQKYIEANFGLTKNEVEEGEKILQSMRICDLKTEYVIDSYLNSHSVSSEKLWVSIKELKKRIVRIHSKMMALDRLGNMESTALSIVENIDRLVSNIEGKKITTLIKYIKKNKLNFKEASAKNIELLDGTEEENKILDHFNLLEDKHLPEVYSDEEVTNFIENIEECDDLRMKLFASLFLLSLVIMKKYKYEVIIKNACKNEIEILYLLNEFAKIEDTCNSLWNDSVYSFLK